MRIDNTNKQSKYLDIYIGENLIPKCQELIKDFDIPTDDIDKYLSDQSKSILWLEEPLGTNNALKAMAFKISTLKSAADKCALIIINTEEVLKFYKRHANKCITNAQTPDSELLDILYRLKNAGIEIFCIYNLTACPVLYTSSAYLEQYTPFWSNISLLKKYFLAYNIKIIASGDYSYFVHKLMAIDEDIKTFTYSDKLCQYGEIGDDEQTDIEKLIRKNIVENIYYSNLFMECMTYEHNDTRYESFARLKSNYLSRHDFEEQRYIYEIPSKVYQIFDLALMSVACLSISENQNRIKERLLDMASSFAQAAKKNIERIFTLPEASNIILDLITIGALDYFVSEDSCGTLKIINPEIAKYYMEKLMKI